MPRVISGKAGGLQLKTPTGMKTRPSADRTKEGMFSALSARVDFSGLHVLDLYSGSGQLGIEALSRGAASAVFVERHRQSMAVVKENLVHCGFEEQVYVIVGDAVKSAALLAEEGKDFDLIFMDPPYAEAWAELAKIERVIMESKLLRKNGRLVFESDAKAPSKADKRQLLLEKSCQYGSAMVSFYRHPDAIKPE